MALATGGPVPVIDEEADMLDTGSEMTVEGLAELHDRAIDALDLAIAAGAPLSLLEKLGASVGLLEGLAEVPQYALLADVVSRARRALSAWQTWNDQSRRKVAA